MNCCFLSQYLCTLCPTFNVECFRRRKRDAQSEAEGGRELVELVWEVVQQEYLLHHFKSQVSQLVGWFVGHHGIWS